MDGDRVRKEIDRTLVGKRVRMVRSSDKWSPTKPGTLGTVRFIDDTGTIFVDWEDGSRLGMIPGADRWEVLP